MTRHSWHVRVFFVFGGREEKLLAEIESEILDPTTFIIPRPFIKLDPNPLGNGCAGKVRVFYYFFNISSSRPNLLCLTKRGLQLSACVICTMIVLSSLPTVCRV